MTTCTSPVRTGVAVVTGVGVAAPNGLGADAWWAAVLRGESGIRPVTRFDASGYPARLAGEVPGFVAEDHVPSRLLAQTDQVTRLSLVAAKEALDDAGVDPAGLPEYAAGVVTASSAGGFEFGQRELQALWSKGSQHVSAYQSFAWFYAVNTGQISIRHGLRGASGVLVTEQAGGLDAVGQARRQVRKGSSLVVTGAVDSGLCPWGWTAHLAEGRISLSDDPGRAFVPFSADAQGYVPGEGGALLVLEDAEAARAREARVYGTVAGYASTFDPAPAVGGGSRLGAAAELALADAGVRPDQVDVVFADAAGERAADRAEARVLAELFGERGVPVTAPKSMTGRLAAGGSSLDLAAALFSVRDQVIPPTTGTVRPADDCPLDLVTGAPRRDVEVRTALVLARGRGGFNSAAVVRA
ncbi:ketosynthase chain-length factor [Streptomyces sp. WAC05374]|uniref:ketosynthase chain-length factor n=1 Tax=Streptomyces sp. WAC05374 TaxID=2487420 RepID=UPI000F86B271|nr:ketosynthase chain-length factor [Streptomyces sp. WAC05374]RST16642.1 ketosynthase chain-length factor [Streptomyces sp. WAC05374]TDF35968.1 ketosynthase chain-length factor [Streptomyces sp. WAC05374]TDF44532.1 ketosynthase chain-length factor [Streptomyces sp. WAC05374]TDF45662.1 ketosynthase chain-length factor [Streptomyces sp. WAC05374]